MSSSEAATGARFVRRSSVNVEESSSGQAVDDGDLDDLDDLDEGRRRLDPRATPGSPPNIYVITFLFGPILFVY